jgi:hypothetical protein
MKDFSIKDFLIHILHGGIIVAIAFLTLKDCKFMQPIVEFVNSLLFESVSVLGVSILLIVCYLFGLIIDPFGDFMDTVNNFRCVPTYFLLRDGKCKGLRLPYHRKIREMLEADILTNGELPKKWINCRLLCIKLCREWCSVRTEKIRTWWKKRTKKIKKKLLLLLNKNERKQYLQEGQQEQHSRTVLWEDKAHTMLFYNYAKYRAFAYGNQTQIKRIEAYYMLFIFYRNMIWTTLVCTALILRYAICNVFNSDISLFCKIGIPVFIVILGILIMRFCYNISYKFRTYYCREVLNAVYYSKDKNKHLTR